MRMDVRFKVRRGQDDIGDIEAHIDERHVDQFTDEMLKLLDRFTGKPVKRGRGGFRFKGLAI